MLFQSKAEKLLDEKILRMKNNFENNYKDAAQENFKEYKELLAAMKEAGKVKGRHLMHYEGILKEYEEQLKKFTHKDQPTQWGHWDK